MSNGKWSALSQSHTHTVLFSVFIYFFFFFFFVIFFRLPLFGVSLNNHLCVCVCVKRSPYSAIYLLCVESTIWAVGSHTARSEHFFFLNERKWTLDPSVCIRMRINKHFQSLHLVRLGESVCACVRVCVCVCVTERQSTRKVNEEARQQKKDRSKSGQLYSVHVACVE